MIQRESKEYYDISPFIKHSIPCLALRQLSMRKLIIFFHQYISWAPLEVEQLWKRWQWKLQETTNTNHYSPLLQRLTHLVGYHQNWPRVHQCTDPSIPFPQQQLGMTDQLQHLKYDLMHCSQLNGNKILLVWVWIEKKLYKSKQAANKMRINLSSKNFLTTINNMIKETEQQLVNILIAK